jgi:hypothetical protein
MNFDPRLRNPLSQTPGVSKPGPKYATLGEIRTKYLEGLLSPMPCPQTLKSWLAAADVPTLTIKSPAKRLPGPTFYEVEAVKRFIASLESPPQAKRSLHGNSDGAL